MKKNNQNKKELKQAKKEMQALLEGFFGNVINYKDPKPLKVGFFKDFIEEAERLNLPFSKTFFRKCLHLYTMRNAYLKAIIQGGPRYDIQGKPCGEVVESERNYAKEQIKKKKDKLRQKNTVPSTELN